VDKEGCVQGAIRRMLWCARGFAIGILQQLMAAVDARVKDVQCSRRHKANEREGEYGQSLTYLRRRCIVAAGGGHHHDLFTTCQRVIFAESAHGIILTKQKKTNLGFPSRHR